MSQIPRKIWIYWHQGWDNAPKISRRCLESWRRKNPDWEVNALDSNTLSSYIQLDKKIIKLRDKNIQLQGLSDIIRICLIQKYGGVWADSTCLCVDPLDAWIDYYTRNGFFAFANPNDKKKVASWFLSGRKGNNIVNRWYFETINYWNRNQTNSEYYWFHFLFNKIYEKYNSVKEVWDNTPKIDCRVDKDSGPLLFAPDYNKTMNLKLNNKWKKFIDQDDTPLYKLNWKVNFELNNNTVVDYLLNKSKE